MSSPAAQDQPPIVVPLDGSERAERALPIAVHVALALQRPLLLVQVMATNTWVYLPPGAALPPATYQEALDAEDRAAHQYLLHVAERLSAAGLQVSTRSLRGDPASGIIDTARERPGALIVMTSHGRTGLARFVLGSVADRVVTYGLVPTLLIRALNESATDVRLERAIVPVDGSETAEHALPMAKRLAGNLLRRVTLIQVVDPEAPAGVTAEAQHYLDTVRKRLEEQMAGQPCAIDTSVLYGKAEDQIVEYAAREGDLVIMGTHGRNGIDRWAYGSVASRVVHSTKTPLLLVPTLADA